MLLFAVKGNFLLELVCTEDVVCSIEVEDLGLGWTAFLFENFLLYDAFSNVLGAVLHESERTTAVSDNEDRLSVENAAAEAMAEGKFISKLELPCISISSTSE